MDVKRARRGRTSHAVSMSFSGTDKDELKCRALIYSHYI